MSRIAILADSGCQIAINEIPGVYIVPLQVIINEKTYLDEVDIDSKTVFEMMRKDKLLLPKTSQPSSGAIVEAITQLKEDGYDEVLAITIATGLSSTLSGVHLACEMEKIPVTLIDSKGTAGNHKYLVEVALQLINEGRPFGNYYYDQQSRSFETRWTHYPGCGHVGQYVEDHSGHEAEYGSGRQDRCSNEGQNGQEGEPDNHGSYA